MHFALGSCLFFVLCQYPKLRHWRIFIAAIFLLGILCAGKVILRTANAFDDLRAMIELIFLSAVTLSLLFLRPLSHRISASLPWRPIAALGSISYSLYLVRQFNLHMVASIARYLIPAGWPPILLIIMIVSLHVTAATLFWYCCERPFVRRKPQSMQEISAVDDTAPAA